MPSQLPFEYKRGKSNIRKLVFLIFLSLPFACWLTLIISIAIALFTDNFYKAEMPQSLPWIVFGVLVVFWIANGIFSTVQRLKIDHNAIVWAKSGRTEITVARDDIQKVSWQRDKIIFETAVEKIQLSLTSFPFKERVIINSLIVRWVPRHALSNELQTAIEIRNELLQANLDSKFRQAQALTSAKRTLTFRILSLISLGILFITILIAIWIDSSSSMIPPISLLSTVFLFDFWIIWQVTNKRAIAIDDNAITYTVGRRKQRFQWEEIDVVYFQISAQRILVWVGNRYKALNYKGMNPVQVNQVAQNLEYFLLTHGIEYAYG
jgi:hypothetical protein